MTASPTTIMIMPVSRVRLTRADLILAARTRADLKSGAARQSREAAGLSAAEVARSLGVSVQAVSAWETGKASPTAGHARDYGKLLAGLAPGLAVLGCHLHDLPVPERQPDAHGCTVVRLVPARYPQGARLRHGLGPALLTCSRVKQFYLDRERGSREVIEGVAVRVDHRPKSTARTREITGSDGHAE